MRSGWCGGIAAITLVGCGNPASVARQTAARDHGCRARDVVRTEDEADGYWLDVCGDRRFYRREVVEGARGTRFYDATASAGGGEAPEPSASGLVRATFDPSAHATALELELELGGATLRLRGLPSRGVSVDVVAERIDPRGFAWDGCTSLALGAVADPAARYAAGRRGSAYVERVIATLAFDALAATSPTTTTLCGRVIELTPHSRRSLETFVRRWSQTATRPAH